MGEMIFDGFGVEVLRLPLDHGDGPLGTFSETGRETVTVMFGNKPCFAVYKFYGPFRACLHALATAVTFFIIYIDYLSFDFHRDLLVCRAHRKGTGTEILLYALMISCQPMRFIIQESLSNPRPVWKSL